MFKAFPLQYKAILLALIGYSAFSFADVCAKWLTPHYSIYQIIALSQTCAVLLLLVFSHPLGKISSLWNQEACKNAKIHLLRGILNALISWLVVYAFISLPLATVYTAVFTKPYFAALMGAFFFGQAIGLHRALAISAGFIGILIAFQPWTQHFSPLMSLFLLILPIIIALMFSAGRWLKGGSMLALAFWPILISALVNFPLALTNWQAVDWAHAPLFIGSGLFCAIGVTAISRAFQIGDSAAVSPMLYIEMLWGLALGYIIFGDLPTASMLVGSAIIIGSGIYLIIREKRASIPNDTS